MSEYAVKDSGQRKAFASGMVRDTTEGKVDYGLALDGPMFERWAAHLTKGAVKYEKRNWMKAAGEEELERFKESALRHFLQWLRGDRDEDHAAAVFFNINGAEYTLGKIVLDELEATKDAELPDVRRYRHKDGFSDGTDYMEVTEDGEVCLVSEDGTRDCASEWTAEVIRALVDQGTFVEVFE